VNTRCAMSARRISAKRGLNPPRGRAIPVAQPVFPSALIVQRKCACGGECNSCRGEKPAESSHPVQAKLALNAPGDVFEQEADRIAEQAVPMLDTMVLGDSISDSYGGTELGARCNSGNSPSEGQTERGRATPSLQTKTVGPTVTTGMEASSATQEVLRSPGHPLEPATRAFMEPRLGHDFSAVRLHSDSYAEQSARLLGAAAYTVGNHIAFASGRLEPDTREGKRLIAHELTHVIQQNRGNATNLQRSPENRWDPVALPKSKTQSFFPAARSTKEPDPNALYFQGFGSGRLVTSAKLLKWAEDSIWDDVVGNHRPEHIFSLLQRNQDVQLNAIWERHLNNKVKMILGSHAFDGPEEAREGGAIQLKTSSKSVIDALNHRALVALVQEIKNTLHSGVVPRGASLIRDRSAIEFIEERPEKGVVPTGRWAGTATVGFTWGGMRLVSTTSYSVIFEVIGHEGIYFELSSADFLKTEPFMHQVAETVTKGTAGIAVVGAFIKGFLSALASPVIMAADTAAKIIDTVSLGLAAGVKWTTGREIAYTCISSTCQNFDACVKSATKSVDDCKADAVTEALKQATIILPLYEQGRDCINGDAEACGGIAALSLGLVEEGVSRIAKRGGTAVEAIRGRRVLSPDEFEDAAIREAIHRPHAGDPPIAETLEKPKPRQEPPTPPAVKAPVSEEPTPPATGKDAIKEKVVHESAREAGSEVPLTDGTHGMAPYGEGEESGLTICSEHCNLVRRKLDQILKTLPDNYDAATLREINYLANKVRGIDRALAKGRLSRELARRASHEIAVELARYAKMDPNLNQLLQMTPEYLKANLPQLRRELRRGAARARDISQEFGERETSAQAQHVEAPRGQLISESALERDVMDELGISDLEAARRTPGGAPQLEHFDVGNFGHTHAEALVEGLPPGLDKEVTIRLPDGTIRRADRVQWNRKGTPGAGGTIYEIKPNTGDWPQAGRRQAEMYARYMQEVYGGHWDAQCLTYKAGAVRRLVRKLRRR